MEDNDYSTPSFSGHNAIKFPSQYKFVKVLGEGGFGKVVKCWKTDSRQVVAVKVPLYPDDEDREIPIMKKLMRLNLDQHNIVKFFDWFDTTYGRALVFEMLDISLYDYIRKTNGAPMRLSDIRAIIQQLATALEALKRNGVIHNDIKPDNIMMVNHRKRPFSIKLIDFGQALLSSTAKQGMTVQTINRSPEIILGLPFSEGIDMWSLGYTLAIMVIGHELIPLAYVYDAINAIVKFLGQPPDHLLDNGQKTERYFTLTESNSWRLKTHQEFWGQCPHRPRTLSCYSSLDDLKHLRLECNNKAEAVERGQCIDLLEAMLELDQNERITPRKVLTHPFIVKDHNSSNMKTNKSRIKMTMKKTQKSTNGGLSPASTQLPTSPIMVRPNAAKGVRKMHRDLEISLPNDIDRRTRTVALASVSEALHAVAALREDDTNSIHPGKHRPPSPTRLPSGVILVQPAAPENTLQLEEDEESAVSLQTDIDRKSRNAALCTISEDLPATAASREDDTNSIHPDHHCPPSPTRLPSGVILVQPAAPENTLQLEEDEESAVSLQTDTDRKSRNDALSSVSEDLPTTAASREDDTNSIHPGQHRPASPTRLPSGVILVQPAAPENTLQLEEDEESAVSSNNGIDRKSRKATWASVSEELHALAALREDDTNSIHPGQHRPASPTHLPSGVILVQPAAPENTLQLEEDEESAVSLQTDIDRKSRNAALCTVSEDLPATAASREDDTNSIHPGQHRPPSPTRLPSGVILVQPAASENTLQVEEDKESAVSLQTDTDRKSRNAALSSVSEDLPATAALSEDDASSIHPGHHRPDATAWISQDSTSCGTTGTQETKKKKKNCVQRSISWMRKTFYCHNAVIDVNDQ